MFSSLKKESPVKKKVASPLSRKSAPSIISSDMNILGNVISEGFLDIDGRVEGNVRCITAAIREHGVIRGDVTADAVEIYGHVAGIVKAKAVTLYATAKVEGTIMHESLSIEDGAFVDGKFKRMDKVFIDDDMTPSTGHATPDEDSIPEPESYLESELRRAGDRAAAEVEEDDEGDSLIKNLRLISG